MDPKLDISIVIPVYNSASYIQDNLVLLSKEIETLASNYEIILVEDCGTDNSWDQIVAFSKDNKNVKGLRLNRNFGQHNALLCGIREAKYSVIITMDDDGQHPAQEIPKLLSELKRGFDVVYATPKAENHGFWRNLASTATKWTIRKTMGVKNAQQTSAFRAFRRSLRDSFQHFNHHTVNIDIMLSWATQKFSSVEVERPARAFGESGYTFRKLLKHAVNMATGFSDTPLRLASYIGLTFAGLGFLLLLYTITIYAIYGSTVPGFAFLASLITLFSGVQLLTIGIIGEYVARIHVKAMGRPSYYVAEKTNN